MQYDVSTPAEYMESLADDWRREALASLRELIKDKAPELAEGVDYKMLSYRDAAGVVFYLNAQKHYVSLYVGDASKVDPSGELLQGLDRGKGCVRFKRRDVVAGTRIAEFIERTTSLRREGADVGC